MACGMSSRFRGFKMRNCDAILLVAKKEERSWDTRKWQFLIAHCSMSLWHRKEPFCHLQAWTSMESHRSA